MKSFQLGSHKTNVMLTMVLTCDVTQRCTECVCDHEYLSELSTQLCITKLKRDSVMRRVYVSVLLRRQTAVQNEAQMGYCAGGVS